VRDLYRRFEVELGDLSQAFDPFGSEYLLAHGKHCFGLALVLV
jgi:hypothetical protein